MLFQPKLPDLNELSRRNSPRSAKPSEKAKSSKDPAVRKIFGLVAIIGLCVLFYATQPFAFAARVIQRTHNIYTSMDGTINTFSSFAFSYRHCFERYLHIERNVKINGEEGSGS